MPALPPKSAPSDPQLPEKNQCVTMHLVGMVPALDREPAGDPSGSPKHMGAVNVGCGA